MPGRSSGRATTRTSLFHTLDLSEQLNWPRRVPPDDWGQALAGQVRESYPTGLQRPQGIPLATAPARGARVAIGSKQGAEGAIPVGRRACSGTLAPFRAGPPDVVPLGQRQVWPWRESR